VALAIITMARKPPVPSSSALETNPQSFDTAARKMLETALSLHAGNRPLKCDEIDQLVASVCGDGKSRGLHAEQLIIELKQVWYSVPETASHEKADVISRLVSMCILDFYRTHPDSSAKD
jgi:hypothetical protein